MRKDFLTELFDIAMRTDWESVEFAAAGDKLIQGEKQLNIFKESREQQILFSELLSSLDCDG